MRLRDLGRDASVIALSIGLLAACSNPHRSVSSTDDPAPPQLERPGAMVTGTVYDVDRTPVSGALITPAAVGDPPRPIPEFAVFSETGGSFSWRLDPGEWELSANYDGRTTEVASFVVAEEDLTVDLHFTE